MRKLILAMTLGLICAALGAPARAAGPAADFRRGTGLERAGLRRGTGAAGQRRRRGPVVRDAERGHVRRGQRHHRRPRRAGPGARAGGRTGPARRRSVRGGGGRGAHRTRGGRPGPGRDLRRPARRRPRPGGLRAPAGRGRAMGRRRRPPGRAAARRRRFHAGAEPAGGGRAGGLPGRVVRRAVRRRPPIRRTGSRRVRAGAAARAGERRVRGGLRRGRRAGRRRRAGAGPARHLSVLVSPGGHGAAARRVAADRADRRRRARAVAGPGHPVDGAGEHCLGGRHRGDGAHQAHLPALAADHRDPRGGHRRQPADPGEPGLDGARRVRGRHPGMAVGAQRVQRGRRHGAGRLLLLGQPVLHAHHRHRAGRSGAHVPELGPSQVGSSPR